MLGFSPIASQAIGEAAKVDSVESYIVSVAGRSECRSVVAATARLVYAGTSVNDKMTIALLPGPNINLSDSSLSIRLL